VPSGDGSLQGGIPSARDEPVALHILGCRSVQYGSFEDSLVCLARACRGEGLTADFVYPEPPASERFVADVRASGGEVSVVPGTADSSPRGAAAIHGAIRSRRPRIVHGHFGRPGYLAVASARTASVGTVLLTKHHLSGDASYSHRLTLRSVAAMSDRIVCVSQAVQDELVSLGIPVTRTVVIPVGVDPARFALAPNAREQVRDALGIGRDTFLVTCVSHLREGKGLEVLLAAMATVVAAHPEAVLALAGDGELRETLEAQAASKGIAESVRFLGMRDDVPDILAASDLFVNASFAEGGGLVVIEAMAAGIPVVSTPVGLAAELADNDLVVAATPGRADSLAGAIVRGIEDGALRTRLAAEGVVQVRSRFDAATLAGRLATAYASLSSPEEVVAWA
jgi:glycosyltransferase involved in cell wall biosynthesis